MNMITKQRTSGERVSYVYIVYYKDVLCEPCECYEPMRNARKICSFLSIL